ncbi:hypothetical protein SLEP1_g10910 [Rubroshorea leprosula]|uniref:Uncharacterized protein n=1 Tax=Rubroshorea leprosula TaxID=152421 RepID=A0AAV5IFI4_9ROSI|nr:hypothetical protein SLEP1_g10910 [Rubroshorea leprosula]
MISKQILKFDLQILWYQIVPRLIRTRPASRTWKWWVNLPAGAAAYTKSRTRDLLKLKQAAYHLIQPLVGV